MQVNEIKESNSTRTFLQQSHMSYRRSVSQRDISSVLLIVPSFLEHLLIGLLVFPVCPLVFRACVAACFGRNLQGVWYQLQGSLHLAFMLLWLSASGRGGGGLQGRHCAFRFLWLSTSGELSLLIWTCYVGCTLVSVFLFRVVMEC